MSQFKTFFPFQVPIRERMRLFESLAEQAQREKKKQWFSMPSLDKQQRKTDSQINKLIKSIKFKLSPPAPPPPSGGHGVSSAAANRDAYISRYSSSYGRRESQVHLYQQHSYNPTTPLLNPVQQQRDRERRELEELRRQQVGCYCCRSCCRCRRRSCCCCCPCCCSS